MGGFGYGLYLLSSDPEPEQTVVAEKPVTNTISKPKPKKDIPPPPEEKWEYVESLPQREVEVVAKEIQVSKVPYVMQCGAYKNQSQAEERKLAIAFQGMSSRVIKKKAALGIA